MTEAPRRTSRPPAFLPQPPFDAWPVQSFDGRYGFTWYVEPAVLCSQSTVTHATVDSVRALGHHIDLALKHRADEVAAQGGLLFVHDWRSISSYDAETRAAYIAQVRARPRSYMRHSSLAVSVAPILRMAIQAGGLAATMATGSRVEVVSDPGPALFSNDVQPPRRGARFPGR